MTYDAAEVARLKTNREKVEALMLDFGWHSSVELMAIGGMRAVGRLNELKDTWDYEKKRQSAGVWLYRLKPKSRRQPDLFDEVHV